MPLHAIFTEWDSMPIEFISHYVSRMLCVIVPFQGSLGPRPSQSKSHNALGMVFLYFKIPPVHFRLLLSVSVCFSQFLSVSVCFCQFLSVSGCFFPFQLVSVFFSSFPSSNVHFCSFLSVSVCFCLFLSEIEYFLY